MKNILCFGDSNTYGYNPENGERYDWGIMWPSILEKKLRDRDIRIIDAGLCGRTTIFDDKLRLNRRGVDVLPVLLEMYAPIDTVIVMLGTNDCKAYYAADENAIGGGIAQVIDIIKTYSPESNVLLMSPIELAEGVWHKNYDPEFNKTSVEVSKRLPGVYKKIAHSYGIDFLAASKYAKPSKADREHLDKEGHKSLARAVLDKLDLMGVV